MCSLFSQPLHKEIDITEHNCSQTGDYGPNGWTTKFVENWLDLQAYSISVQLTACDKQGTSGHDAGAALSNIFISDLGGGAECPLSTFTCDIGLGETARALQEEQGCCQRDFNNLEEWASKECVMAKTAAVLHIGCGCHSGSS